MAKCQPDKEVSASIDLATTLGSDGTISSSNDHAEISMGRESPTLNDAIRSAVADVRRHGLDVDHGEIEQEDLAEDELAQWQTA